jgi:hypothetical protein
MIAVQVADLNFVPFWPAGAAVKAISSATVTLSCTNPKAVGLIFTLNYIALFIRGHRLE